MTSAPSSGFVRGTPSLLDLGGGLASLALGLLVIVGWYSRNVALLQIHPAWVPMQFNTALGFVLAGLSLVVRGRWGGPARAAGGTALVALGGATLVQYVGGVDLGIDQLLMEHYVTVETSNPGRMAPNTALSFVLVGAGLGCATSLDRPWARAGSGLSGALVVALGFVALAGYVAGIPTAYGWGQLTRMAAHTALGFVVLGGSLFVVALPPREKRAESPAWITAAGIVAAAALFVAAWQALSASEGSSAERETRIVIAALVAEVEAAVGHQLRALERMAGRWARRAPDRDEWNADAYAYVTHSPLYVELQWTDRTNTARWSMRAPTAPAGVRDDWHRAPEAQRAMARAGEAHDTVVVAPIALGAAGHGFVAAVPIRARGRLVGFLLAAFRFDALLPAAVGPLTTTFRAELSMAGTQVARLGGRASGPAVEHRADLHGVPVTLRLARVATAPLSHWLLLWTGLACVLAVGMALRIHRSERRLAARTTELAVTGAELERSNRALGEFAHVASHDLRAPLRDVRNLADWIRDDCGEALPERSQQHLAKLCDRVERMDALLVDLLAYARAGRVDAGAEQEVDLVAMLENVSAMLPERARLQFPRRAPTLHVPPAPLEQVLRNLLSNAVKHNHTDEPHVVVDWQELDDRIRICVSDDGPGVAPKDRERVFEAFQTAGQRRDDTNTGLGLAIVKRLVEAHGGQISLEDAAEGGARVCFSWPRRWRKVGSDRRVG